MFPGNIPERGARPERELQRSAGARSPGAEEARVRGSAAGGCQTRRGLRSRPLCRAGCGGLDRDASRAPGNCVTWLAAKFRTFFILYRNTGTGWRYGKGRCAAVRARPSQKLLAGRCLPGFAPRAAFLNPKPNRCSTCHQKSLVTGSHASFLGTKQAFFYLFFIFTVSQARNWVSPESHTSLGHKTHSSFTARMSHVT